MRVTRPNPSRHLPNASWGRWTNNASHHFKNFAKETLQNHGVLRGNGLILSSFILVCSRIAVSFASSQNAKGTKNQDFRRMEFIRTTLREGLAFPLSFLLLRAIERITRTRMRMSYLRQLPKAAYSPWRNLLAQLKADWIQRSHGNLVVRRPIEEAVFPAVVKFTPAKMKPGWENIGWLKTLRNAFPGSAGKTPEQQLKLVDQFFPTIIGTIPAVGLSGFWLENFSLYKADHAVELINRWFGGATPVKQEAIPEPATKKPTTINSPLTPEETDFKNYLVAMNRSRRYRTITPAAFNGFA